MVVDEWRPRFRLGLAHSGLPDHHGPEVIDANDAKEMLQSGQKSAAAMMKSATKSLKKSIHNSAKQVAAMTRSKGSKVSSKEGKEEESYVNMTDIAEDKDDDYVFT